VTENPAGRFERLEIEPDPEACAETFSEAERPTTLYLRDASRSALARNRSPDIPFDASLNPYRGCEHGCAYCYARPTHEYLGFSAGLDFETRILVKTDAPELLRRELLRPGWRPQVIALSGVTDPYQPVERKLELTRRCLQVLAEFRNPAALITKSRLVVRDLDVLAELARFDAVSVTLSVTTLDAKLARELEPRAAQPRARLAAVRRLAEAGVPVGVNIGPVIPGLTDHEIPAILEASAEAGAGWAGYIMLRLPYGVRDLFAGWLETHRPDRRTRVLNRVRDVRGGRLNDPTFGSRMRGTGLYADQIDQMFKLARRRAGLERERRELSTAHFRRPSNGQRELFSP
jgi:DNA repair photolyase